MVLKQSSSGFTLEGLQNFGLWLWMHRTDKSLWNLHLTEWFKENCYGHNKLTQFNLCMYLADVTGYEELEDYEYRYKLIEKMRNIKSLEETRISSIDLTLSLALAKTEFLSIGVSRVGLSKIDILKDVINGTINPIKVEIK